MFANVAQIVRQFKQSWSRELEDEAIRQACRDAGHQWRERQLGPVATVKMFLLQILFGNVACEFVPHLAGKKVTGSAYCTARGRVPLAALQMLLTRCTAQMAASVRDTGRWLGHRLFLLDGSSFSMPDTDELRNHFGQSGGQAKGCGFPTAHWLALLHFGSGLFQKVLAAPLRTHDLNGVAQLHPELEAGDVLLGDRAFGSFGHLACLALRGLHGIFRAHQKSIVDFTPGTGARRARQGKERPGDRQAAVAVDRAPGRGRPDRRMVPAAGGALVAVAPSLGRPAGDAPHPRAALHAGAARPSASAA